MRVLAIDPGADGGQAYFENGILTIHKKIPSLSNKKRLQEFQQELQQYKPDLIVLEEQTPGGRRNAGQKNGQKALFGQGMNYGRLLTVIMLCDIEYIELPNAAWTQKVPEVELPEELKGKLILTSKLRSMAFSMSIGALVWGPKGGMLDGIADAVSMGWLFVNNKIDKKYYPKDWSVAA